jgi:hypothetical protein
LGLGDSIGQTKLTKVDIEYHRLMLLLRLIVVSVMLPKGTEYVLLVMLLHVGLSQMGRSDRTTWSCHRHPWRLRIW